MSALGTKLRKLQGGLVAFWCPGCNAAHNIRVFQSNPGGVGPLWMWNQSPEKPTFEPSILVNAQGPYYNIGAHTCHSFIKDGQIQFLSDCTHLLSDQTVPLPDFPTATFQAGKGS